VFALALIDVLDKYDRQSNNRMSEEAVDMDIVSWKLAVNNALGRFLGLTGESIPADILHTRAAGTKRSRPQAWIRVPEPELSAAWAALSGAPSSVDSSTGSVDASIRVLRASHYLVSIASHSPRGF
jgi:hypothetical protein